MPPEVLQSHGMALLIGYFLGSIPFGMILTKLTGAGDLRSIGSGNIGATNVLRTGKKGLAALTLLLDMGKGWAAILLVEHFYPGLGIIGAAGAFLGHLYPIWLGFKGGKGVATLAGIAFGIYWPLGVIFAVIWLGLLFTLRISSVAGMAAAAAMPIAAWALDLGNFTLYLFIFTLILVLWKHRENIRRLQHGEEPKVGSKK